MTGKDNCHFIVMLDVQSLQSTSTVALLHSRTNTSEPGAVSWQSSVGSPSARHRSLMREARSSVQDCGMLTVRSNQPAQRDVVMDLIAGRRRAILQFSEAVPRAADPRPAEESVRASNQHERRDGIVDVCQPLERRVCTDGSDVSGRGGSWSARGAVRRLTAGCTLEPWNHTSKRAKLHHLSVRQDRAVLVP